MMLLGLALTAKDIFFDSRWILDHEILELGCR